MRSTLPAIDVLHLAAFIGVGIAAWILAPAQVRLAEPAEATRSSGAPVAAPTTPEAVA